MHSRWIVALVSLAFALTAGAQTVYKSKDKDGPVFSDVPSPGASAVELPPANVIQMPVPTARPTPTPSAPPSVPYRNLVIVVPEAQGTIHSNTGAFDIRAQLSPALRGSDRILVSLDGNLLKSRFRSPNVHITEADWNAAANSNDAQHSVQLTVVDAKGEPLIASAPVSFYVQRATVAKQRRAR
jgi:hypothetical protein